MSGSEERFTIGKVAAATGVGVETIRFYEREGLLEQPTKSLRGFRHYPPAETLRRIEFIRRAKAVGFTLEEVRELLSLRSRPGAPCKTIRERALAKRDQIEAKISELSLLRDAVEGLLAVCTGRVAVEQCSIIGALDGLDGAAEEGSRSNSASSKSTTNSKRKAKSL